MENDKRKLGETMKNLQDLLQNTQFKVSDGKNLLSLNGNRKSIEKFKIDNTSLVDFLLNEIAHMKKYKCLILEILFDILTLFCRLQT